MYGGGGGIGGGGRVWKALSKSAARAGLTNLQEPISSPSSAANSPTALSRSKHNPNSSDNFLSLSSACNAPVSPNLGEPIPSSWPYFPPASCDEYVWVSVDGGDDDDDFLGPVPSLDEVHSAVSALTQVIDASSYSQFVTDKLVYHEGKNVVDQITSPPGGVFDAFHLLQSEPAIQKMVVSLSSDKAVWNAVMNNNVVRELRDSYNAEDSVTSPTSESSGKDIDDSNPIMNVVKWIFQNTKAKFIEVMENITKMLNELLKPPVNDKKTNGTKTDSFEEKLRTSFMLSVVVLLIVVVSRAQSA